MGVVSLVSFYALTEVSDLTVKDVFCATLESVVDRCPKQDTLLILRDFIASTGTDRDGYETCVGPQGSGTVNLIALSSLTLQEVMDLVWPVHGFSTHKLIAGLGIPTLAVWQRRLTMSSLMSLEDYPELQGLPECSVPQS